MKKSFISIIVSFVMIINIFTYTTNVIAANTKSNNESYSSTQAVSALEQGIKELLSKDIFKSAMGNKSIHEIFSESINQGALKELSDALKNNTTGISITKENFKTDESTYKWISNVVVVALKNAINKGILKQSDIDQINSSLGMLSIFGIKKISIDLNKKDYTDAEIEKITVELLPTLDKLLNPTILKFAGIDLTDKKFWDEFVKQIQNAIK